MLPAAHYGLMLQELLTDFSIITGPAHSVGTHTRTHTHALTGSQDVFNLQNFEKLWQNYELGHCFFLPFLSLLRLLSPPLAGATVASRFNLSMVGDQQIG